MHTVVVSYVIYQHSRIAECQHHIGPITLLVTTFDIIPLLTVAIFHALIKFVLLRVETETSLHTEDVYGYLNSRHN